MKTIYNNEAIESYLEFINRVVKEDNNEETESQYKRFLELFNQYMTDEVKQPIFDGFDIESYGNVNIEITYNEIEQVWAFIHFCLNKIIGMEDYSPDGIYLNTSFTDYTLEDVDKMEESLSKLWYLTDKPAYIIYTLKIESQSNLSLLIHVKISSESLNMYIHSKLPFLSTC